MAMSYNVRFWGIRERLDRRKPRYDLAHEYRDQRWDRTPGNTRRTPADAFATITPALVRPGRNIPGAAGSAARVVLVGSQQERMGTGADRGAAQHPRLVEANSLPVSTLAAGGTGSYSMFRASL
ncbi:hypothetical protein GCM10010289_04680 [Streptomyces violascens]|uniref:Uncharacterized protein n=1 Tax=Streptomyces violascens TaxID=67381 RepID=A0ABQ3QFT2_9ACTN|nr:hypothetical protein GCM10010289_04680 [Streptomyces violascens]GHI36134.1 hypothetical protein Sviol_05420 [Streptomyces violascens]